GASSPSGLSTAGVSCNRSLAPSRSDRQKSDSTIRYEEAADPEGFEPSRAGLEIRSPIRARRRVRSRARNAKANNPSTRGIRNRSPRDESQVFEARDATERSRRSDGVHDGLGDFADRDVVQGI